MSAETKLGPEPRCLPGCDEQHAEECPWVVWEAEYWRRYFGLKRGAAPEVKAHNKRQLAAFAPPGTKVDDE